MSTDGLSSGDEAARDASPGNDVAANADGAVADPARSKDGATATQASGRCAAAATILCDDFERAAGQRDSLRGPSWTEIQDPRGKLAIVNEDGRSFLRAMTESSSDATQSKLVLKASKRPAKALRAAFDVRIPSLPRDGTDVQTATIQFGAFDDRVNVVLFARSNRIDVFEQSFREGSKSFNAYTLSTLSTGAWHDVTMSVVFEPKPTTILVEVDGKQAFNVPAKAVTPNQQVELSLGVHFTDPTPDFRVDFDNAWLSIE